MVPQDIALYIYDLIGSPDKTYREFGVDNGDLLDYGHLDLLFGIHAPDEVYPEILDWLVSHTDET